MPGQGRDGRRELISFIARWLGGVVVTGGLAAGEADRVAAARITSVLGSNMISETFLLAETFTHNSGNKYPL
jgi:hypothetical protein